MTRQQTTEQFIEKANKVHNNKYDYSLSIYTKSKELITIICKKHGEFSQAAYSHLRKRGCPDCNKTDIHSFIEKANKKHNFKYEYYKVNYQGTNNKVTIICKIHGEFKQQVNSHLQGAGCPGCNKTDKNSFIEKANLIHNNKYNYIKSNYTKRSDKIIIICPLHGEFEQCAHNHLKGQGCPICSIKARVTEQSFLKKAVEIHKDLYDYSQFIFTTNKEKSTIICKLHGPFLQDPDHHINQKQGCPSCSAELTQGWSKSQFKKQCQINNKRTRYFLYYKMF